ncbi:LysM peptidoglycan-binding domain-containing protein [Bacillus shivajii]|uniref:cell division suppressor protein YneA n=1 Tax=Bacillus shivajii TaxID=1983719 RepID=UPI001CFA3F0B|nr:LysM peptidoglycan-binding domain-containing protein [Bacillus shivajii]UCZ51631.1 LysM peptidoglycan-binding domain-containing protein [Bacillus shivajii]
MVKLKSFKRGIDCSIFVLFLAMGLFIWTTATASELPDDQRLLTEEWVVEEGQSLWTIASVQADNVDMPVQSVILWIQEKNELNDSNIYPGQKLTIPVDLEGYVTE